MNEKIKHELISDHYDEYKYFTRLILSLSTASLAVLITFYDKFIPNLNCLYILSLFLLFLSSFFGVLVQHCLMYRPLDMANDMDKDKQSENPKIYVSDPSKSEKVYYILQMFCFLLSYFMLIVSIFLFLTYR